MVNLSQVVAYFNFWIELILILGTYYCSNTFITGTFYKLLFWSGCLIPLAIIKSRRQLQWSTDLRIINRETQIHHQLPNPVAA